MKKNKIIILGSNSFIAKSIIKKLKSKKIEIKKISRREINLSKKSECIKLKKYINKNDKVLFIAAKAPVKNIDMLIYNIRICQNICNFVDKNLIKHITYISSDAVYKDSSKPLNENSLVEPDSLHGLMHMTREKILKSTYGNKLCILRPTLIYGRNDPHNGYGPNKFLRNARSKTNIQLFGKGEEKRDHVWVEDVAEITVRCIIKNITETLNITSGKILTFKDIAKIIREKFGSKIKIIENKRVGPMPHNGYREFDNKKINKVFKTFKFNSLKNWIQNL